VRRRRRVAAGARLLDIAAWGACALIVALVAWAVQAHRAAILNTVFPAACVGVGLFLYLARPVLYVGFAWWLYLVVPFVRRLVDYQVGVNTTSPILATSLAVTSISVLSLFRYAPRLRDRRVAPMVPFMLALALGYVVGLFKWGLTAATHDLAQWLAPLALGLHITGQWRRYLEYRQVVERVFLWGVLLIGTYGLVQFFAPQAWDLHWMLNSSLGTAGAPVAMELRVFSTLNSPGPFATFMMGGLLLLLGSAHVTRLPSGVVGLLSLLLSLVRSAWLASVPGLLILLARASHRRRLHITVGALAVAIAIVPVISLESIAEPLSERVVSLGTPTRDNSLNARLEFTQRIGVELTEEPLGFGLGSTTGLGVGPGSRRVFDNGVLHLFYVFGWIGGLVLAVSTLAMVATAWSMPRERVAGVEAASAAILVSSAVLLLSGPNLIGVGGLLFWTFAGLSLSARRYARAARYPDTGAG
jgi:hypothetical protein